MSQTADVLDYLQNHASIDGWTAIHELGCMRLGARIYELKALGVPIAGRLRTNPDTGKRWKEYWIAK